MSPTRPYSKWSKPREEGVFRSCPFSCASIPSLARKRKAEEIEQDERDACLSTGLRFCVTDVTFVLNNARFPQPNKLFTILSWTRAGWVSWSRGGGLQVLQNRRPIYEPVAPIRKSTAENVAVFRSLTQFAHVAAAEAPRNLP